MKFFVFCGAETPKKLKELQQSSFQLSYMAQSKKKNSWAAGNQIFCSRKSLSIFMWLDFTQPFLTPCLGRLGCTHHSFVKSRAPSRFYHWPLSHACADMLTCHDHGRYLEGTVSDPDTVLQEVLSCTRTKVHILTVYLTQSTHSDTMTLYVLAPKYTYWRYMVTLVADVTDNKIVVHDFTPTTSRGGADADQEEQQDKKKKK